MRAISISVATVATLVCGPALSEGWSGSDLGVVSSFDLCTARAESVLYAAGAKNVVSSDWMIQGYDIDADAHDAVIVCMNAGGERSRATTLVFSNGDRGQRMEIRDRIERLWDARN